MRTFNKLARIAGTVAVAGAAAAAALAITPGTFGGFTSDTVNPGNSVAAGTLTMDNSLSGSAVVASTVALDKDNMQPGDIASGTVEITNDGSLPADMSLAVTGSNNLVDANELVLTIKNEGGTTVYTGPVTNVAARALGATWAAGDTHVYTVTVELVASAGNDAQGTSASFTLNWHGQQH